MGAYIHTPPNFRFRCTFNATIQNSNATVSKLKTKSERERGRKKVHPHGYYLFPLQIRTLTILGQLILPSSSLFYIFTCFFSMAMTSVILVFRSFLSYCCCCYFLNGARHNRFESLKPQTDKKTTTHQHFGWQKNWKQTATWVKKKPVAQNKVYFEKYLWFSHFLSILVVFSRIAFVVVGFHILQLGEEVFEIVSFSFLLKYFLRSCWRTEFLVYLSWL